MTDAEHQLDSFITKFDDKNQVLIRAVRSALRPAARRVHVSRLVEVGQASTNVGRMVISGRMEDVCAELDRLVLREATLH